MLYLLLGVRYNYETGGQELLKFILQRYDIFRNLYRIEYCYEKHPPTRAKERQEVLLASRAKHEAQWAQGGEWTIVGFGAHACELLTGRGKTRMKDTVGTKWDYVGNVVRRPWITYDPTAALYDPNLVVDITAVILAAARDAGLLTRANKEVKMFDWEPYL